MALLKNSFLIPVRKAAGCQICRLKIVLNPNGTFFNVPFSIIRILLVMPFSQKNIHPDDYW